jgi:hypothetical protein
MSHAVTIDSDGYAVPEMKHNSLSRQVLVLPGAVSIVTLHYYLAESST